MIRAFYATAVSSLGSPWANRTYASVQAENRLYRARLRSVYTSGHEVATVHRRLADTTAADSPDVAAPCSSAISTTRWISLPPWHQSILAPWV
jgi:hypothetical protein